MLGHKILCFMDGQIQEFDLLEMAEWKVLKNGGDVLAGMSPHYTYEPASIT